MTLRQEMTDYIRKTYVTDTEYPQPRHPDRGVFRHTDSRKQFALFMTVPRARLGLDGADAADVVNVKLDDLLLRDLLLRRPGFFPGCHISRGNWISVLLDGTVPAEEVRGLIDRSFRATASAGTRRAIRGPKEWLIPSNPAYYDVIRAFSEADEIDWKQGAGIRTGDTVFLYVGAPVSAVLFRCAVTETDIPYHFERDGLTIRRLMRIRLLKRYDPGRFPLRRLQEEFGVYGVRGPRGVPPRLLEALDRTGKDGEAGS